MRTNGRTVQKTSILSSRDMLIPDFVKDELINKSADIESDLGTINEYQAQYAPMRRI